MARACSRPSGGARCAGADGLPGARPESRASSSRVAERTRQEWSRRLASCAGSTRARRAHPDSSASPPPRLALCPAGSARGRVNRLSREREIEQDEEAAKVDRALGRDGTRGGVQSRGALRNCSLESMV
jgi:hypothetical protein